MNNILGLATFGAALEDYFLAAWDTYYPGVPVATENSKNFRPRAEMAWLHLSVGNIDVTRLALTRRCWRYEGVVLVQCYTPMTTGTQWGRTLADTSAYLLRDRRINGVVVRDAAVVPIGQAEGWWQVDVTADYYYDMLQEVAS